MIIKTKIDQLVKVWQTQEICVEVESLEQFKQLKSENRLDEYGVDWGSFEVLWDTAEYIQEDDEFSEIIEIIEE